LVLPKPIRDELGLVVGRAIEVRVEDGIAHAHHCAMLLGTVEVNFMAPRDEPLLWAADALAGATLACVTRSPKAGAYADALGGLPIREVA
jgi:hypothetical protein